MLWLKVQKLFVANWLNEKTISYGLAMAARPLKGAPIIKAGYA